MNIDVFEKFHEETIKKQIDAYITLNNDSNESYKLASRYPLKEIHEEYLIQKTLFRVLMGKPVPKKEDTFHLCRHKVCACMTAAILKCRPIYVSSGFPSDLEIALVDTTPVINEQLAFSVGLSLLRAFVLADSKEKDRHVYFDSSVLNVPPSFNEENVDELKFDTQIAGSLYRANVLNNISTPLLADIFFYLDRYHELHCKYQLLKQAQSN